MSVSTVTYQEHISVRGVHKRFDAIKLDGQVFIVRGGPIRTATLKHEWLEDLENPARVIAGLESAELQVDLLSFWQRIPDTEPTHSYYHEIEQVAAIPITTYEQWLKDVGPKTRNMVRKSVKQGVSIVEAPFNEDLVRGISTIFNESPVRRGKPFWHYRKSLDVVRNEMGADLDTSLFIGAFCKSELIGFIKLYLTTRYAMITMILDLNAHRDKAPMNGMIARAVEACAARSLPYLTYTIWRRGNHGDFQKRNGFTSIAVPRYFVPLSAKGAMALRLGLHRGVKGALPDRVVTQLLNLRARWYQGKELY